MFLKKAGLPEESELVICTVTNIQYSTVFVMMDDYDKSGMIHISEIAAGRIRNIRDYVKEDKKIVCKVLRVNSDKGHVDLSLRRVSDGQRRKKINEAKLEQKAESIVEYIAKQHKVPAKVLYEQISKPVFEEYEYLYYAFEESVAGHYDLSKVVDKKYLEQLSELVEQRFKPKRVEITGVMAISSYESDGVILIKNALSKADEIENVEIRYLGGGKYKFTADAEEYKEAEQILKESTDSASVLLKNKAIVEFKRTDKK